MTRQKFPVYYFTPKYFTSGLSPHHFPYQPKQLKGNKKKELILFHPEKQNVDQYLNPRSQQITLSNLKGENTKHNRDGTIVTETAVTI